MPAHEHLARRYAARHPQRCALALADIAPEEAAAFLEGLDPRDAVGVLGASPPTSAASITQHLASSTLARFAERLTSAASVAMLRTLSAERREAVLAEIPEDAASAIAGALRAPRGSLGAIAEPLHVLLSPEMSVRDARDVLRETPLAYAYVVDEERRLVGVVHRRELSAGRLMATIGALMTREVVRLPSAASPWALRDHPAWRDFDVLPVVDERGVFVGILRHRSLRRLGAGHPDPSSGAAPAMNAFLELGELYWGGLANMLAPLEVRASRREKRA